MRSDLAPAFLAAMRAASRKPRQLLVFHFNDADDVCVSDQPITLGGVTYRPLIEDWGELTEAGDPESEVTGGIRQMTITLWNGGAKPFSDYFLGEDPENVEVDLYQWFYGLADSDKALLDRLVVQDPIEFDETSRLLKLDLVSIGMRYDARIGKVLTRDEWPKALEAHLGKTIDLILGAPGQVKTVCAKTAPQATLNGSIIGSSITIAVREDLNELGFPAAGEIQVDEEHIYYSSRTASAFTASIRGYRSTEKAAHSDGAQVIQRIFDHTYLVGQGPVQSITGVQVAGHPAPTSIYSVDAASNPARIIFNQKPYSNQHSVSVELLPVSLDAVGAGNSAYQPYYAYDDDARTSSAMIDENHPVLALTQVNANVDVGQITTAYLSVTHWATNYYQHDYVEVWIQGVGVVGRLSRPSSDDNLIFEADVDIDHPHDHESGGYHYHTYTDPQIGTNDPAHVHPISGNIAEEVYASSCIGSWLEWHYESYNRTWVGDSCNPSFSGNWANAASAAFTITVVFSGYPGALKVSLGLAGYKLIERAGTYTFALVLGSDGKPGDIWWKLTTDSSGGFASGDKIMVTEAKCILSLGAVADLNNSGVSAYRSANGAVYGSGSDTTNKALKDRNDVKELLTANRVVDVLTKKAPTRTIIDLFDLSDYLEPTWAWFTGRNIQVRYVGTADDVMVLVTNVTFEVEVRRRERVYSDEVSASVVGVTDNRPDQVIRELITAKAGLPESFIDEDGFATAATRFVAVGYRLDGVLSADITVREALRKICVQTRSRIFWSGGKIKLKMRELQVDWQPVRSLGPNNLQLRSITVRRQRVDALVNLIELFFGRDHLSNDSGKSGYTGSVRRKDNSSITRHGQREDRERWLFDLVTAQAMAEDLAEFYLAQLSVPSTFYQFICYLDQLDLEVNDVVEVTSAGFNKMLNVPVELRAVERLFGSGKQRVINRLRIVAENLRYLLREVALSETVNLSDTLNVLLSLIIDLADGISATDDLRASVSSPLSATALVSDLLESIWQINDVLESPVTVSSELAATIHIFLEDTVKARETIKIWQDIGFGGGGFGLVGFGGVQEWAVDNPDDVFVWEILVMVMGMELEGTVNIEDSLVASDGFGSPNLGDGFGLIPFGK